MSLRLLFPRALLLCIALLAPGAANATGSLDCSIEDRAVAFSLTAVFGHGLGSPISNLQASLALKAKDAPAGPPEVSFGSEHLVHSWLRGREIRLHLYREPAEGERGPALELVIETRGSGSDADSATGRYEMTASRVENGQEKTRIYKGKARCGAG
ncbi:hypothetical protein [Prosthecomicrobium sp. N25]|uniref:hypothetical protein n=1 Tax=Prosthecomicrobium sp. N25 TaxID=3129254 RepID=UPI003076A6C0